MKDKTIIENKIEKELKKKITKIYKEIIISNKNRIY